MDREVTLLPGSCPGSESSAVKWTAEVGYISILLCNFIFHGTESFIPLYFKYWKFQTHLNPKMTEVNDTSCLRLTIAESYFGPKVTSLVVAIKSVVDWRITLVSRCYVFSSTCHMLVV